ncbi:hypothetical protein [Pseudonocardia acidicola]|uniref:Uncharacterized protein n=1 Tax=Pseudonocardia acidicola TaxID=2724939 RepID=A0ABX1SMQ7_9PSEU|nr:hypothetical protein [Pseudonocardia acidicola]NMI02300.1 hypothetical protein [Pseudonocardia acidicola]
MAVYAGATHGIFFGDAEIKFKSADLDGIMVTDTIALCSAVFDGSNHIFSSVGWPTPAV